MISYNRKLVFMFIGLVILIFIIFVIGKKEQNNQLQELGINSKQTQEVKNDVDSLNEKYSSDSISSAEDIFLTANGLKKDSNGLYYTYDKYQLDSKMIYFKKEDGKWKWSILLGNWDNIDDYKYDNSNSIYNGYEIKQDKNKKIFDELKKF